MQGVDYRLQDLFHAVTPTKLPREEFYREYAKLYSRLFEKHGLLERDAQGNYVVSNFGREGSFPKLYGRLLALNSHHDEPR
jgi:hypothetical protein